MDGFRSLLVSNYLPHSKMYHLCIEAFAPGWFTLPTNFNKAAAETPKSELKPPSNNKYPCFIAAYVYNRPHYDMVCIHQALRSVQHWRVHQSWLEFLRVLA